MNISLNSQNKGLLGLIMLFFITACSSGMAGGSPTEDFLKSPLSTIFANGIEGPYGITVQEFISHGINPKAEKSWKKIEEGTWSLLVKIKDNVTGNITDINFVLVQQNSPTKVILQRILVNGTEANPFERDQLANNFAGVAIQAKNKEVK